MKKILCILTAAVLLCSAGLTAAASPSFGRNGKSKQGYKPVFSHYQKSKQRHEQRCEQIEKKKTGLQQKKLQFKTKREEWRSCRKGLNDKRKELFANKGLNQELLKENKQLRRQLSAALKAAKDSPVALPEATAAALKDYKKRIKAISAEIKAGKGKILELLKQNRELIKKKDYVQMDLVYEQIADIQLTRNDQLKAINDLLVKMIELL